MLESAIFQEALLKIISGSISSYVPLKKTLVNLLSQSINTHISDDEYSWLKGTYPFLCRKTNYEDGAKIILKLLIVMGQRRNFLQENFIQKASLLTIEVIGL